MPFEEQNEQIKNYFEEVFNHYGPTPQGVNWNSERSQILRFDQLLKVCDLSQPFRLIDYGCGYGALAGYLIGKGLKFEYTGYDISERMIAQAHSLYSGAPNCRFTTQEAELPVADFTVASGIFNKKLEIAVDEWQNYILRTLKKIDNLSIRGFAFNMLTGYSDPDRMQPDLYYGDPCFFFSYCKQHFARNVALLHDYEIYDFTVIVRK